MRLARFLRKWFSRKHSSRLEHGKRRRPRLEVLEDRTLPAAGLPSGIAAFLPSSATWYIRDASSPGSPTVAPFAYGASTNIPLVGDFNGDQRDSIAVYDSHSAYFYLRDNNSSGTPDAGLIWYGAPGWLPLAGDWDGDGRDSIGAFDPTTATFYLRNSNSMGSADAGAFAYGAPGWLPLVGDWDGDGKDGIGVFDPTTATFYLRNSSTAGTPDAGQFSYGAPGWTPVVGDWNGDGKDSVGVVSQEGVWYLQNRNSAGAPDLQPFAYGMAGMRFLGMTTTTVSVDIANPPAPAVPYTETPPPTPTPDPVPTPPPPAPQDNPTLPPTDEEPPPPVVEEPTPPPNDEEPTPDREEPPAPLPDEEDPVPPPDPQEPTDPEDDETPPPPDPDEPPEPTLLLQLSAVADSNEFTVTASLSGLGDQDRTNLVLDVDLNRDGQFATGSETFYDQLFVLGDDAVDLTAAGLLPGTYLFRVRALDEDGEERTSESQRIVLEEERSSGFLPLVFEPNFGQTDPRAQFVARSSDFVAFLTATGLVFSTHAPPANDPDGAPVSVVQHMNWLRSNLNGLVGQGESPLPGTSNYFIGNDPSKWITDAPNYSRVRYSDVWAGVDVIYRAQDGMLRVDYEVDPHADVSAILLSFPDARGMEVDSEGRLVLHTVAGTTLQSAPVAYQVIGGVQVPVQSRWYVIVEANMAGFLVESYDPSRPLIIDPFIYNTFVGGGTGPGAPSTGFIENDLGNNVTVDTAGNAYVIGQAASINFPTTNPVSGTNAGFTDVVVSKLNSNGSALVYSTYLGGADDDFGLGIALDDGGNAYLTGETFSTNFPTTAGVVQGALGAGILSDAFIAKLNSTGNQLVYSTYYGGEGLDRGWGVAIDSTGNAYVAGETGSLQLPVTGGAFQTAFQGGVSDAFVVKINSDATALAFSTYLGGTDIDVGYSIAVDSAGNPYITGETGSTDLPTLNAFQNNLAGLINIFVTKLNNTGTGLVYSSYLGGINVDRGFDIVVDNTGSAYLTGGTDSPGLATAGVFQGTYGGGAVDGFVAKVNPAGNGLVYFSYLGGDDADIANSLVVDAAGNAYVVGLTFSTNFPLLDAIQSGNANLLLFTDAFVSVVNADASSLLFSTYIGGDFTDVAQGVAVDPSNNIYVVGFTDSGSTFPVTPGAVQTTSGGGFDIFVAKLQPGPGIAGGFPNPPDDALETNNTSDRATDFGLLNFPSTFSDLTINKTSQGLFDQDWYRWTAGASGTFNVAITIESAGRSELTTASNGDLHLRVFRLNSNNTLSEIGSSRSTSVVAQGVSVGVSAGDVIFVWVFGFDFSLGTYEMTVSIT